MADRTIYVDTDVAGGTGDGSSWENAYDHLADVEALNIDCVSTQDGIVTVLCRGVGDDHLSIEWDGWATDATHYVLVKGNNTTGKYDATKYKLVGSLDWYYYLRISDDYIYFEDVQISNTSNNGTAGGVRLNNANCRLERCIVYHSQAHGIVSYISAGTSYLVNCVVYGSAIDGIANLGNGVLKCYNCVSINNTSDGFYCMDWCSLTVTNCYAGGNGGFDYLFGANAWDTVVTSYSEDGSEGTTTAAFSTSSGCYFTNVTGGSEDIHIGASSTLIDAGTDLHADAGYAFATDIEGTARPDGAWDIGADEYVAAGGGVASYKLDAFLKDAFVIEAP